MASSRPIAAGEDYTPDDINSLRNDVLDPVGGHNHNATDGRKIAFSNLDVTTGTSGSAAPSGGAASYNQIGTHVTSSNGQHGHHAAVHVAGSDVSKTLIQGGTASVGATVTFPVAYSSTPNVVVTGKGVFSGTEYTGYVVSSLTTSNFIVTKLSGSPEVFCWIAIGIKNP